MKQLIILCMVLFTTACSDVIEITPSGKPIRQSRSIGNFSEIKVSQGINLSISQAESNEILIEADDNIIQYVEAYTIGQTLHLEIKDGIDIQSAYRRKILNISVSTPVLRSLVASGGSEIRFMTPFHLNELDIIASGGTNITGEVYLSRLMCDISGGSTIRKSGNCGKIHIMASGSSEYHLYDLISGDVKIDISGSSIAEVHATKTLHVANASGGCKIFYKGDAQVSELNLSGGSTILKQ